MDQFIAAYPGLVISIIVGLLGICGTLIGVIWRLANSTLKGIKQTMSALNETLGEAFREMRGIDSRLSKLEGAHEVNHAFKIGGSQ